MNKQDLINYVAEETGLSKVDAKAAIESVFKNIEEAVKGGTEAAFVGFGTFKPTHRAARNGRNPKTGETIQIAATTTVTFKPSQALKDAVK